MATSTWQQILLRAQQTLAVWQQHSPPFKVGTLTLAAHQADGTALAPAGQADADAEDVVDDARAARDAAQATVNSMNTRLPRKLDGELLPDDPFHADLEDVRTIDNRNSGAAIRGKRGRETSGEIPDLARADSPRRPTNRPPFFFICSRQPGARVFSRRAGPSWARRRRWRKAGN
jgi:hypothetical protein